MNQQYIYPTYSNHNLENSPARFINNQPLYLDSFFPLNQGVRATFYLSFRDSIEWKDTIFKGRVEDSTGEYTVIREEQEGKRIFFWNKNIDYIIFEEARN